MIRKKIIHKTPLQIAIKTRNNEIVKLLLSNPKINIDQSSVYIVISSNLIL